MVVTVLAAITATSTVAAVIENPEVLTNSVLNFLTIALLVYREHRFKRVIEPKVQTVMERTEHLDPYDPENGRREEDA